MFAFFSARERFEIMLEAIREHAQGWIAKVILVLITIPFALWGIDSYFTGGGNQPAVASIDDAPITQPEFFEALKNRKDSLEQRMGGKVDMENKAFRREVLDQLLDIRLLSGAALNAGMKVTDAQVAAMLAAVPTFQENGQFSEAMLARWLEQRGMSRQALTNMVREDLLMRQLQLGYTQGAVVAKASAQQLADLLAEQREVNEVVFEARAFMGQVSVDDKAISAEYQAHQQDYATPAQVRLQYLVLSNATVMAAIQVSDATAQQFYEANRNRYQEPEQRRASHILIRAERAAKPEARQAARVKAEMLLAEARKTPARFADLARQHSEDPGSGAQGGDLGFFTRDRMVKPFADAAFAMKTGEISNVVESDFGFHIIRLEAITPSTVIGFSLVKDTIINELRQQEAQRKFAEVADRFSNMVYEQADSLEPAAKEFQITLQESGWVSRQQAEPALLGNARLLDAVFSPEALEKKQNTEAIEVSPGTLVAARVLEHKPAGVRPLQEVTEVIRLKLSAQAAQARAVEAGKQALQSGQSGQAVAGLSAPMPISRMQPLNVPPEAMKAIFKADVAKLPAHVGIETREGYRVYRINAVKAGSTPPEQAKNMQRDLTRMHAQEELRAYLEYNRARAAIKINDAILEKSAE
jgi:peptidyl-prolyl cis-trans isomerase D